MSDLNINQFIAILPKLIRENDAVKGAILSALSGVVATREDIKDLIQEMDKRFEVVDKRFEAMQKQMDKRFEAMQKQMDKRFDAVDKRFEVVDKRFEAMQKQMDKRFDAVDKRFDAVDKRFDIQDKNFDQINGKLDSLLQAFGKPFEQFARNVIERILEGEGKTGVHLEGITFTDSNFKVSKFTTVVEIDGFSRDPPVIVEITTILKEKEKIMKFLRKKSFIEEVEGLKFRGFFVAASSKMSREEIGEISVLLHSQNCELINL
ncbi:MAG: hypothetical protein ACTSWL_04225 [Promethearchaeota archaeon]